MRESNRFFTAPLIVVLLMLSFLPITTVSADETPTTIDMFEGGYVSLDVTLDGNSSNLSSSILVPRNVTFIASSFVIEVDSTNPSPGQVFVDVANVWGVDYDSSIDNGGEIRSSFGIGIDWLTPVGPLNFTLAETLSKADGDVYEAWDKDGKAITVDKAAVDAEYAKQDYVEKREIDIALRIIDKVCSKHK